MLFEAIKSSSKVFLFNITSGFIQGHLDIQAGQEPRPETPYLQEAPGVCRGHALRAKALPSDRSWRCRLLADLRSSEGRVRLRGVALTVRAIHDALGAITNSSTNRT